MGQVDLTRDRHNTVNMGNMDEDIRWKQRYKNYKKALASLKSAVELAAERELSDLEKQGMIQ